MKYLASVIALGLVLAVDCGAADRPGMTASGVVILANSDDPDSVPIAEHYARARHVPEANIVALPMPLGEAITWTEFVGKIWNPLEDRLVKTGWIDAIPMEVVDPVGRTGYAVSGHKISALVVCRGVPLKISNDPALYRDPSGTTRAEFRTNAGAVDSELSLLAVPQYPISAYIPNPMFGVMHPSPLLKDAMFRRRIVIASRLDGSTAADALALVDNAILGEKTGLIGRAYIDTGGPHPSGDVWLRTTADRIGAMGIDVSMDASPMTFPEGARFDRPVFYFGWYTSEINGPFLAPGFRFPPGAVALHIFSFSANSLRTQKGWTGGFVSRGVTATVGNVYEPYLELTHRPDMLVEGLSQGLTWGEAAYYALPAVSWQAIAIGDPLYRPIPAGGMAAETARSLASPDDVDYAVIGSAHKLSIGGHAPEALRELTSRAREHPSMVACLAAAQALTASGNKLASTKVLAAVPALPIRPVDWGLAHDAAAEAMQAGDPALALSIFQRLLADRALPRGVRMPWVAEAKAAAVAARDESAAAALKDELDRLVAQVLAGK